MDIETLIKENALLREENEKLKKQLENYNNSRKSYSAFSTDSYSKGVVTRALQVQSSPIP